MTSRSITGLAMMTLVIMSMIVIHLTKVRGRQSRTVDFEIRDHGDYKSFNGPDPSSIDVTVCSSPQ